ncbi:MAG: hypothetical protein AB2693_32815, partial [Candidatus Thiodiazotropha sp.]
MPTTRQQTTQQEQPSLEFTLNETEYGDSTVAEMNFQALMMKLDQVVKNLATVTENVGKIFDLISARSNQEQTNETINTPQQSEIIPTQTATQQLCDNIRELINETNQPTLERDAYRIKKSIENTWFKKLNDRRKQYWLKLRNENLAKVYEAWRDCTPIILPQQLQIYPINGEPEDQRRRRERQVLDNFRTEKDLLVLRAQSHEEKFKRIDEEMLSIISEKCTGRRKEILIRIWNEDTKQEEETSLKRWKAKNEMWLKKYESDFKEKYITRNPFIKDIEDIQPNNYERRQNNYQYRRPDGQSAPTYADVVRGRRSGESNRLTGQRPYTQRDNADTTLYIGQRFRGASGRLNQRPRRFNNRRQTGNMRYRNDRYQNRYNMNRGYGQYDTAPNREQYYGYGQEDRRDRNEEEASRDQTARPYQDCFLEQGDQTMQEL